MEEYIYEASADNQYRYVLGTKGKNPLIVMSINPSAGSPTEASPTVGTIRHIAAAYGHDSWIILCLYPQRATHLDELTEIADPVQVAKNNEVIESILSKWPNRQIWAAWGTHYFDRSFFTPCLENIVQIANRYNESWIHYGPLDEDGTPRYCLYLEDGEGWFPFNVQAFLENSY